MKKLRCYLELTEFTAVTDHSSLTWLQGIKDSRGRLERWTLQLSTNRVKIEHRKGTLNEAPDTLSRLYENPSDDTQTTQLNVTRSLIWYDEMVKLVQKKPTRYQRYKLNLNNELYYFKPNALKQTIGDNNAWKKVLKESEILPTIARYHDLPQSAHQGVKKRISQY